LGKLMLPGLNIEGRQQEVEAGLVSQRNYRVVEPVKVKTNKYSCNIHHIDTKNNPYYEKVIERIV